MKTNKSFAYGIMAVIIALLLAVFAGCKQETDNTPKPPPVITAYSASPATITVPAENSVQLNCTATSADGSAVKSIQWTVEQKPALANPTIDNAQTDTAAVNDMEVAGTYKFKLVVTGNNDATKTEYVTVIAGLYYEVEFEAFTQGNTLSFHPKNLPYGVTYTLNDGTTTWNSAEGFDGTVNASSYENSTTPTFTQIFFINGIEITRQVIWARMLFDGFSNLRDAENTILNPQAIPSLTLKWPADMSLPITHAITVPAIAFSNNPVLFSAQTYTGYTADFPSGCITYKIVDDKGHTWNEGEAVNATDTSLAYTHYDAITFTQTFYYNNQEVGSRSVKVRFSSLGSGTFSAIDVNGSWASSGTIPELTLLLRKEE